MKHDESTVTATTNGRDAVPVTMRDVVPTDAAYRYGVRLAAITTPDGRDSFAWPFDRFDDVNRAELADALGSLAEIARAG